MKLTLLFLSVLMIHSARCQRRGPWRGMRPPPRRLPPCIEERLRSIAPNLPNYRPAEVPTLNRLTEIPPGKKIEVPSTLEAVAQLAKNIPKPDVSIPTADFYQNVLLSPNLFTMVPNQIVPNQVVAKQIVANQIVPNQIVPNQIMPNQIVPSQLVRTEIPRNYQVPMQNLQYFQNLLLPKPEERVIPEIPVVEVPRTEKIFVQTIEPEKPCPCDFPSPSINPFLPAASPLSPWMASNLPSPPNQSRSHFLRKIPMPPPTI